MLTIAALLLFLLPLQVSALITTEAKCLAGYDWMFSSVGQSPCDVAAELASVCIARPYTVDPLPAGYVYVGPTVENQNICKCNSVYYSLLSGCAYCQDRSFRRWSLYVTNCTMVYHTIFPEQIPVGVRVPAYAYLNISTSDGFNATLAYRATGPESTRPPSSSTQVSTSTSSPTTASKATNMPAIIGGAVGGVVALGLIAALITFLVLRSKKKQRSQDYKPGFQQGPNMAFTPNTATSLLQSAASPPPGTVYNPNDPSTFSSPNPSMYDPHRQYSPPVNQNPMPNFTGNSAQSYVPPQAMLNQNPAPNFTGGSAQNYVPPQAMPQHSPPLNQNPTPNFTGGSQDYVPPQAMPQHSSPFNQNPAPNFMGNSGQDYVPPQALPQHSLPSNQNPTPNFTGSSAQNYAPPQTMPLNTAGRSQHPGVPEF